MLNYFLLQLDQKLKEKPRTCYMMLERQFRNELGLTIVNMSENSIVTGFINPGQHQPNVGGSIQITAPRMV